MFVLWILIQRAVINQIHGHVEIFQVANGPFVILLEKMALIAINRQIIGYERKSLLSQKIMGTSARYAFSVVQYQKDKDEQSKIKLNNYDYQLPTSRISEHDPKLAHLRYQHTRTRTGLRLSHYTVYLHRHAAKHGPLPQQCC